MSLGYNEFMTWSMDLKTKLEPAREKNINSILPIVLCEG